MSIYQYPHPWSAGFAIPKYVLSEPQGRGTFITKQLPRGTIGTVPKDRQIYNRTKWAAPNYTQGRYDKSAQTTKMLPRRTVGLLAPDFFSRPSTKFTLPEPGSPVVSTSLIGPKPGAVAVGSTLDGATIGSDNVLGTFATPTNASGSRGPIVDYGKKGAALILREVMKAPRNARSAEMQNALDSIGIRQDVEDKVKAYKEKGHSVKEALKRAIAAALSNKLVDDAIHAGSGQPGTVFSELGWFGSSVVSKIGSGLASLHCAVTGSALGQTALTVAGGVAGGTAGAAAANTGAKVLSMPCGGGSSAAPVPVVVAPPPPSPLIPIAIAAGGALLLVMVLK